MIGEMTAALLRHFPDIQRSNQAIWYQRAVRDTPSIYALVAEEFSTQAHLLLSGGDPREIEGKHVASFTYLFTHDGDTVVAKTLLASTATDTPHYRTLLAHELLNCFCHAEWDGHILRSGLRQASWGAGELLQKGGALNDLLLDTLLLDFVPPATDHTGESAADEVPGPYRQIVALFARRLRELPIMDVLFAGDGRTLLAFNEALEATFDLRRAADMLDQMIALRDWQGLWSIATRL